MILRLAFALAVVGALQDSNVGDPRGKSRTVTAKDGETVAVRVRISDPQAHVLTAVAFPEAIGDVVSSWDPRDISIEHVEAKLFVKLFSKVEGHLDVVGASGAHYRLYIVPVAGGEADYDSLVTIRTPAAARAIDPERPKRTAGGAIELVRAMRLGEIPEGISARRVQPPKAVGSNAEESSEHLEFRPAWVYDAPNFRGYVIELVNHSSKDSHRVDVSRFRAKDLVLAASRDIIVAPKAKTRLYLVFWKE